MGFKARTTAAHASLDLGAGEWQLPAGWVELPATRDDLFTPVWLHWAANCSDAKEDDCFEPEEFALEMFAWRKKCSSEFLERNKALVATLEPSTDRQARRVRDELPGGVLCGLFDLFTELERECRGRWNVKVAGQGSTTSLAIFLIVHSTDKKLWQDDLLRFGPGHIDGGGGPPGWECIVGLYTHLDPGGGDGALLLSKARSLAVITYSSTDVDKLEDLITGAL